MKIDPIGQFQVRPVFESIGLSNAAFFMLLAVLIAFLLTVVATSPRAIIPGRWQAAAESLYDFVAGTVRSSAGSEGMRFFPFVFSLFIFVLICNLMGLVPGAFTVTSQIVVTFALAALVIGIVIIYGFYKNGLGFLRLFLPSGLPAYLVPLLVSIEVVSFVSRPVSLAVRLFANMLAGHIALKLFAYFVVMLGAGGFLTAILAPLPLAISIAFIALEFLVAVLQAYVFATLTCIYLNDALHPSH